MKNHAKTILLASLFVFTGSYSNAQVVCADTTDIYAFTYNGSTYEVVRENKTWTEAAACSVERGGILAEINDQAEQDAVYAEVLSNASITASNTVAPDGGGASYVWIGGNDLGTEGDWTWDGNNDGSGTQFWLGTSAGSPVGGLYNNWGNEPDDFGSGQDGLGLAITDWPLGVSGQWNDVNDLNTLYYVIEYPSTAGVIYEPGFDFEVYPNPSFENTVTIVAGANMKTIKVFSFSGEELLVEEIDLNPEYVLSVADLPVGQYIVQIVLENDEILNHKIFRAKKD
ncbi:MAG: hypothetical protein ACI8XB_001438 [Patiriisocius sp.]|jgi:hypothetical protein